jgi:FkbM family methyltransferase
VNDVPSWRTRSRAILRQCAEIARGVGVGVDRAVAFPRTLRSTLRDQDIDLVLDVGAHTGGFARSLRRVGYDRDIVSFEPSAPTFAKLAAECARDPKWTPVQAAVSDATGVTTLRVSHNAVSSSLLRVNETHVAAAPRSAAEREEQVATLSFPDALARHAAAARRVLVKLDIQGFEGRVLDAMAPPDPRIRAVVMELSLVHLYDGDDLIEDNIARVRRMGFDPIELVAGFREQRTGALLQVDGIFLRRNQP